MDNLFIYFVFGMIVLAIFWFIGTSNRLKRYRIVIDESKRNVDIALAKRYDTISEMIKVAKSFARHEADTFANVIKLRQSGSISEANMNMKDQDDAIHRIYALAESYPELKSSEEFLNLQDQIDEENEQLAAAKRIVNNNISIFNQEIVSFPASLVAKSNGMTQMDFLFEEDLTKKKKIDNFDYDV